MNGFWHFGTPEEVLPDLPSTLYKGEGCLYGLFLDDGEAKIGKSNTPSIRVRDLCSWFADYGRRPVQLVGVSFPYVKPYYAEALVHAKLDECRVVRELFRVTPEQLDSVLVRLTDNYSRLLKRLMAPQGPRPKADYPRPWYWTVRMGWYVQLDKKQIKLGRDEEEAREKYREIMAARGVQVTGQEWPVEQLHAV